MEIVKSFRGTSFDNDTYTFLSTNVYDAHVRHTYTPHAITAWGYWADNSHHEGPMTRSFLAHEMAHAIELFQRKPNRLLENNYGYEFSKDRTFSLTACYTEARTLGIQQVIEQSMPDIFRNLEPEVIADEIRGYIMMPIARDHFVMLVKEHAAKTTVEKVFSLWHDLCDYVMDNRD